MREQDEKRRHRRQKQVATQREHDHAERLQRHHGRNVWTSGCRSWYLDAQGRNFSVWPTFTWKFAQLTRAFRAADYELTRWEPAERRDGMAAKAA